MAINEGTACRSELNYLPVSFGPLYSSQATLVDQPTAIYVNIQRFSNRISVTARLRLKRVQAAPCLEDKREI